MTELELYQFIDVNSLELDWRGEELILWIPFYYLTDFSAMINGFLRDGGIEVNFQEDCIAMNIVPLCEYFDITPVHMTPMLLEGVFR